jgi:hypothetical protein
MGLPVDLQVVVSRFDLKDKQFKGHAASIGSARSGVSRRCDSRITGVYFGGSG